MSAHIILSAGHRNATGGGTPGEADRTPRFAHAYIEALEAAGHSCTYMQSIDDAQDHRPDSFAGKLDVLAKRITTIARGLSGTNIVMLDLHIEDAASPKGCFVIVPDDPTVSHASADPGTDTMANNARSCDVGGRIAAAIASAAGFQLWTIAAKGIMSERQSDVGSKGQRLAMFRHTASQRDRMVRLIIEHGNIAKDRAIIDAPDTPSKCGAAVARVLMEVFGGPATIATAGERTNGGTNDL